MGAPQVISGNGCTLRGMVGMMEFSAVAVVVGSPGRTVTMEKLMAAAINGAGCSGGCSMDAGDRLLLFYNWCWLTV